MLSRRLAGADFCGLGRCQLSGGARRLSQRRAGAPQAQSRGASGHPLQPWAEYWPLRLQSGRRRRAAAFPSSWPRTRAAISPRSCAATGCAVLGKQGRPEDWEIFSRELPALVQPDTEVGCYAAQAVRDAGKVRVAVDQRTGSAGGLRDLVDQLVAIGGLTVEEVWQRMRRLFEAKRVGAAEGGRLSAGQRRFRRARPRSPSRRVRQRHLEQAAGRLRRQARRPGSGPVRRAAPGAE